MEKPFRKGHKVKHQHYGRGTVANPRVRNGWIIVDFEGSAGEGVKCAETFLRHV